MIACPRPTAPHNQTRSAQSSGSDLIGPFALIALILLLVHSTYRSSVLQHVRALVLAWPPIDRVVTSIPPQSLVVRGLSLPRRARTCVCVYLVDLARARTTRKGFQRWYCVALLLLLEQTTPAPPSQNITAPTPPRSPLKRAVPSALAQKVRPAQQHRLRVLCRRCPCGWRFFSPTSRRRCLSISGTLAPLP
jgi:hypothetical protein